MKKLILLLNPISEYKKIKGYECENHKTFILSCTEKKPAEPLKQMTIHVERLSFVMFSFV